MGGGEKEQVEGTATPEWHRDAFHLPSWDSFASCFPRCDIHHNSSNALNMGTQSRITSGLGLMLFRTDSAVSRQLIDKIYEKRKAAALELEKCVVMRSTCYPF